MALDYRDAVSYKEKPTKARDNGGLRQRWWEIEDEDELAGAVMDTGSAILDNSGQRHATMVRHARLYENCDFESLGGRDFGASIVRQLMTGAGLMSLNVGASCVDTLTAKVTKNHPKPTFLTSGASWKKQIQARNLEKWCRGFFYETKVYQKARPVFVDGCEFGTAFLQVYPEKEGKLCCERVLPNEILVDDLDGQYGSPRQMFRVKYVPRDVLTRLYPKCADEIRDEGKKEGAEMSANALSEVAEDTVEVFEAWHLPSGPGAGDGKHVIAISGCVLYSEPWKIDKFPFAIFRFKRRTTGFWGKGVIETVQPIQVELNRAVRSISSQMHRKGKGRIFVHVGSKVVASHLTNRDGGDIVQYVGSPPVVDNNNAIAQEEFNYVLQLRQQAFQEVGISELSAAAKKPSGLDAAVALREYSDIESERFAPSHQDWEQLFLDYTELAIDLITKQYGWKAYKVLVPGRRDLLEVDWADVDLERDDYVMQMFPASSLPQTPAARKQYVKELRADFPNKITEDVALRLLDMPDIEAETNLANAIVDDVDATISAVLDDGKLLPLEPYQNLDMLIQRGVAQYLYARHRGCPEDRLALLRNLIDNATSQKAALMAPPPVPGGPPMPGAPSPAAPPMPGGPSMAPPPMPGGAPNITNTLNVPPPIIPMTPPVVGG